MIFMVILRFYEMSEKIVPFGPARRLDNIVLMLFTRENIGIGGAIR